jgi:ABC-type transport system involved in multi-copper enzyme maturation permease subunit
VSSDVTLGSTIRSEWIKFRTVRSTIMGVIITFVLTVGLGALITTAVRAHWHTMNPARQLTFDPVSASLSGILFAQFAVGVIGTLFITSEYSSGSIRTTLAAVPNRLELVWGKLLVLAASMFVVSEIACFITFIMGQAIFSGVVPSASLGSAAVVRTVILAGVYLTLLSVLGFSLGLILRQSAACISVFTSLLLILPIIVFLLPQSWQNTITKFEPSELGHAMTSLTTPTNDFGTWTSLIVLSIYVVVVLGVGTTMLIRRDA